MVRLAKPHAAWSDDDDEFPDINALVGKKLQQNNSISTKQTTFKQSASETPRPPTAVRRRRLGPLTDNLLLRAWTPDSAEDGREERHASQRQTDAKPRRTRVELRTRSITPAAVVPSSPAGEEEEYVSAKEEVTLIEEVSVLDDTFHSCGPDDSDDSEFEIYEDEEDDEDFVADVLRGRTPAKPEFRSRDKRPSRNTRAGTDRAKAEEQDKEKCKVRRPTEGAFSEPVVALSDASRKFIEEGKINKRDRDITDTMSRLRL